MPKDLRTYVDDLYELLPNEVVTVDPHSCPLLALPALRTYDGY